MNNIMLLNLQESFISAKIVFRGDFLIMKTPITSQETFVFTQMVQKNSLKVK